VFFKLMEWKNIENIIWYAYLAEKTAKALLFYYAIFRVLRGD